jgi:hypothetical protein
MSQSLYSKKSIPTEIWASIVWVDIVGDQILGPVVLGNRLSGAVYHCFSVNDLPVLLEHVPLCQQQLVIRAWWGTISFSPNCRTASAPDFQ